MNHRLIDVALGNSPADLVIKGGKLVNVITKEIYETDIAVADGWTHIEFSFEVPEGINPTKDDFFSFYTNPFDGAGCSYRLDNIKVTVE